MKEYTRFLILSTFYCKHKDFKTFGHYLVTFPQTLVHWRIDHKSVNQRRLGGNIIMKERNIPKRFWDRGEAIAKSGKVIINSIDRNNHVIEATVYGSTPYHVTLRQNELEDDSCTCPFFDGNGFCKHVAAVIELLESENRPLETLFDDIADANDRISKTDTSIVQASEAADRFFNMLKERRNKTVEADHSGEEFLDQLSLPRQQYFQPIADDASTQLKLEVTLFVDSLDPYWDNPNAQNRLLIRLRIASKAQNRFYIISRIQEFLEAYKIGGDLHTAGKQVFHINKESFSSPDQQFLDYLLLMQPDIVPDEHQINRNRDLLLPPLYVSHLLDLSQSLPDFQFVLDDKHYDLIEQETFAPDNGLITAEIKSVADGYNLSITVQPQTQVQANLFDISGNVFYSTTPLQMTLLSNIISTYKLSLQRHSMLKLPGEPLERAALHFSAGQVAELNQFVANFKKIGEITVPDELKTVQMVPHFDLSHAGNQLDLALSYEYESGLVAEADAAELPEASRNLQMEQQSQQYLRQLQFIPANNTWSKDFSSGAALYRFFAQELPNLRLNGVVTVSDDLNDLVADASDLDSSVAVSENGGLLAVDFNFKGIDEHEVDHILNELDKNQPYITREDGTIVLVDESLKKISTALTQVRKWANQPIKNGQLTVSNTQALAVQAVLGKDAHFDEKFLKLTQNLAHPELFDVQPSHRVHATLRPYQKVGVQWLEMLNSYHFGGILADDMGLGKTIQMIAFLLNHLDKDKPSLIISPASLIYNWQAEFEKFAPEMTVEVVDGSKSNRVAVIEQGDADVLITSYNSARLDVAEYEQRKINYLVLDEAQYVKNSSTKTNQSLQKLNPTNTFALSGTPIENRIEELWAIFQLVMPGLLPSKKEFKKLDPQEIALRVKPFILRREKMTVLKDIPAKVESNLTNEMTKEQKTVYLAQLKQMQVKIQGMSSESFVKNKIAILAGLTRLRQICDTPALYLDDYQDSSGKLEQLTEIVNQAIENNRHVLIFSQFTSMLDIIKQRLDAEHHDSFMLQGNTKPKDRLAMVNSFNQGDKNLFLISLKAGGTGLNLTGADMVILVDLWWNPAVEDQATARAHRIGQKKEVDVFRLITNGTIEEQIYKLQEKKRNFVDQVLSGTQNKGSLTEDEVRLILGID